MNLEALGWNDHLSKHFALLGNNNLIPGRVALAQREIYTVFCEEGERISDLAGKLRHEATTKAELPVVGDWVALKKTSEDGNLVIEKVLDRKNAFSRKVKGDDVFEEQVLVSNVDYAWIVMGLDGDFNTRRLERYLILSWNCGVNPVVILNKMDLSNDWRDCQDVIEELAPGIPVHPISAKTLTNIDFLIPYLNEGMTSVLLGSSGAGKSTIVNALLGKERQRIQVVREDDSRGRHTTTRRELIIVPQGGLIIDNPGMRELQIWADEESLEQVFSDIEELAVDCRFRDCQHESEPDCAIKKALEEGLLDPARFNSYKKIQRELQFLEIKKNQKASLVEKAKNKNISKLIKQMKKKSR